MLNELLESLLKKDRIFEQDDEPEEVVPIDSDPELQKEPIEPKSSDEIGNAEKTDVPNPEVSMVDKLPEKMYIGSAGENLFYYLTKEKNTLGNVDDFKIVDANGEELASMDSEGKDAMMELKQFLYDNIKKLKMTMLSYEMVDKIFFAEDTAAEEEVTKEENNESPRI